jgi:hypothetical protein
MAQVNDDVQNLLRRERHGRRNKPMTNEEMARELTNHNDRLVVVEKGVNSLLRFQISINRKISFVYGASWVLGIVWTAFLATAIWALGVVVPAAKVVIADYYRDHPKAALEQNSQERVLSLLVANVQKNPQKDSSTDKNSSKETDKNPK